jgi:hypothetical protein
VEEVVRIELVLGRFVFAVWAGGVCVSLILLIREWTRAFRFLKSCRIASDREVSLVAPPEGLSSGKEGGSLTSPVRVLVSNRLGSPFCCQWQRPQLVIPEFLLELPSQDLKFIARHELEHLGCGHPLQLFIERLVATAFWFHPVIWWGGQQSALAREYACDDAAVLERQEIVSYLKILLAVAERGLSEEAEGAMLFFGRGASIVALRGRRLLGRAESPLPPLAPERMRWAQIVLAIVALAVSFIWTPLDALASSKTRWSPWPQWSARVLRTFDISARDFEPYEARTRLHEISISSRTRAKQEGEPTSSSSVR